MVPFDRPYTTFCWSAIVNVFGTVFELFDVKWYCDLEIWVRDHSRSFKPVPFKNLGAVFYSPSIVTMAISCIVCDIYSDLLAENREIFIPHLYLAPPQGGDSVGISWRCLMLVKLKWLGYRTVKKLWRYVKPFSSNTGTLRTDGRTDRFAVSISRVSMYADAR